MIETLFGLKASLRVLRFCFAAPNRDFSFKELQNSTGVGSASLETSIKRLVYLNIFVEGKRKGAVYKLNFDNPQVVLIKEFFANERKLFMTLEPKLMAMLSDFESECVKKVKGILDIVLFGSVAQGKNWSQSDTDILILTDANYLENKYIHVQLEKEFPKLKLQIHLMNADDFYAGKKESLPLIDEILKTGFSLRGELFTLDRLNKKAP